MSCYPIFKINYVTRSKMKKLSLLSVCIITICLFSCQKSDPVDQQSPTDELKARKVLIDEFQGQSWDVVLADEDGYKIYLTMVDSINAYSVYSGIICAPDGTVGTANAMYSPDMRMLNMICEDPYFNDVVSYSAYFREKSASLAASILKYMVKECGYDILIEVSEGHIGTHNASKTKMLRDTPYTRCGSDRPPRRYQ